jgi:hypothetical protein
MDLVVVNENLVKYNLIIANSYLLGSEKMKIQSSNASQFILHKESSGN